MSNGIISSTNWSAYFPSTDNCFQASVGLKDDQVTQIVEKLFDKYLKIRLHMYGQLYTTDVFQGVQISTISLSCVRISS